MITEGALQQTSAPATEPITTAEAKTWVRQESDDDDAFIAALIPAARQAVENHLRRALITQTWTLSRVGFPSEFRLPLAPLQSVSSITYTDTGGDSQTLASSEYTVDTSSEPGRIVEAYNKSWPSVRDVPNSVIVTFVAGYGDDAADVPDLIRTGVKMMLANLYENREPIVVRQTGTSATEVPMNVQWVLLPYRIARFR